MIQPGLLREGFELVRQKQLDVTDDVSIVEALGRPVKVTRGSYTNIKVMPCVLPVGSLSSVSSGNAALARFAIKLGGAAVACQLKLEGHSLAYALILGSSHGKWVLGPAPPCL